MKNLNEIHNLEDKSFPKLKEKSFPNLEYKNEKFILNIPENVQNTIRYICNRFPNKEWSGIIFYNHKGSLLDVTNLKLELINLYPLDLGSGVFTEYEFNKDYTDYMMRHPEYMTNDIVQGHVHSHHNMSTNFSGVDTNNLRENAGKYTGFLSLIVNNANTYSAKLAVEHEINNISFKDLDYTNKTIQSNQKIIYVYDAIIKYPYNNEISEEIRQSLKKIEDDKKTKYISQGNTGTGCNNKSVVNKNIYGYNELDLFNQPVNNYKTYKYDKYENDENDKHYYNKIYQNKKDKKESVDELDMQKLEYLNFLMKLLTRDPIYFVSKNTFKDIFEEAILHIYNTYIELDNDYIDEVIDLISSCLDIIGNNYDDLFIWIIDEIDNCLKNANNFHPTEYLLLSRLREVFEMSVDFIEVDDEKQ